MNELDKYRKEIDSIDKELIGLFERRLNVVLKVAEYKKNNNTPILHTSREQEVLDRTVDNLTNKDYAPFARQFMTDLMNVSKSLQSSYIATKTLPSSKLVGFQGIEGSFSYGAAKMFFGEEASLKAFAEFEDVFKALDNGEITAGILPIENSNSGSVGAVYDLLCNYGFYISAEQYLKVDQNLLGVKGTSLDTIKEVYSHEQGFSQCSEFLSAHKDWKLVPYHNTAVSAQLVADLKDTSVAAIASKQAAELYNLEIIQDSINTSSDNTTRFIIISKHFEYENADKISIVCSLDDRAGTLYNLLSYFAYHNINMVKIESRPMHNKKWKYLFYVDFEGDFASEKVKTALELIEKGSDFFRILGAYKSDVGENVNA